MGSIDFEQGSDRIDVSQYCSVKENCLLRQAGGAGDAGAAEGENGTSSSASSASLN